MNFITLHTVDGRNVRKTIVINADQIESIKTKTAEDDRFNDSEIILTSGTKFPVEETVDQIMKLIYTL